MEKSIVFELDDCIREMLELKEVDVNSYSPLVLAYIGDCIYDLIIKTMVISGGNKQVHKLHEETSTYVQASAQYTDVGEIQGLFPLRKINLLQITAERPDLKH